MRPNWLGLNSFLALKRSQTTNASGRLGTELVTYDCVYVEKGKGICMYMHIRHMV